jgi:hypothetical protein
MQLFRELTALGATVIVIHHTGKMLEGASKNYRGSSDIPANADCCWLLEQKGKMMQNLHLSCFKSREGAVENVSLALDGKEFVINEFVEDNDPAYLELDAVVRDHPNSNQSQIHEFLPQYSRVKILKMLGLGTAKGRYHMTHLGLKNARVYTFAGQLKQEAKKSSPLE